MSDLSYIAHQLGSPKKTSNGYDCRCPAHQDKRSSLSLSESNDGKLLAHCHAGCSFDEIINAANLKGIKMLNGKTQESQEKYANSVVPPVVYKYLNNKKELVAEKFRYPRKEFKIKRYLQEPWPLYNLQSIETNQVIYIAEGEKDANNLIKQGLAAVTNISGGSNWQSDFNPLFTDKTVVILEDKDQTGVERTAKILEALKPYAKEIRLFKLDDSYPEHSDVTNWLEKGNKCEDLFQNTILLHKQKKLEVLSVESWINEPITPSTPILDNFFDAGDKVVIIGQSKTRKSFFSLQLALSLSAPRNFLGFNANQIGQLRTLIIQFEIKSDRYKQRLIKMAEKLSVSNVELNQLFLVNARGSDMQKLKLIQEAVDKVKPQVVIIDPLYKLIEGDESAITDIKPILGFFDSIAEHQNVAVIYIHHDKKGHAGDQQLTDRGAGSGVLGRDYDAAIYLSPHKCADDVLVVECVTRNYPPIAPISIKYAEGCFCHSSESVEKLTSDSAKAKNKPTDQQYIDAVNGKMRELVALGTKEVGMGKFTSLLGSVGIPRTRQSQIKEMLATDGYIAVEKRKATFGQPNKVVLMTPRFNSDVAKSFIEADGADDGPF